MKKINIKKLIIDLDKITDDDSSKTIIINNAECYNDLIVNYKKDRDQHDIYMMIQLNGMIIKQKSELKKLNKKLDIEPIDNFTKNISAIKKKYETR